jgi:uncharacterized protein involved in response to NO
LVIIPEKKASTMPDTGKKNYFLSQPHQPFFLFGVIWAIIDILLFGLSYKGVLTLNVTPTVFHAYTLIFSVFTQFFVGFLFTTFPRFCQSDVISRSFYLKVFSILQIGALFFTLGAFLYVSLIYIGTALLLTANILIVYQLYTIYQNGRMPKDYGDSFWILMGFVFSLISHLLFIANFIAPSPLLYTLAIKEGIYLYLVFVAFAVGQRMVPFFSHSLVEKQKNFTAIIFAGFVLKVILSVSALVYIEIIVDIGLALFLLKEFLRWKLPIFNSPSILWVLHLALFWLPTGLFLGALASLASQISGESFLAMQIHLISIGFITTILIGFGTRVTMGHSGQPPNADKLATNIFWGVQVLVIVRALYSLQAGLDFNLFWLFDMSMTLWILIFGIWAWRYGPVLYSGKKLS